MQTHGVYANIVPKLSVENVAAVLRLSDTLKWQRGEVGA